MRRGWECFAELVPAAVADAVFGALRDPAGLVATLGAAPPTLCHGDAWLVNIALTDEAVVLLDWALATSGPASLDLVAFTVGCASHVDLPRAAVLAAAREACRPLVDDTVWDATVFWALCELGWNKALDAATHADPAQRAAAAAELAWWVERADAALSRNGYPAARRSRSAVLLLPPRAHRVAGYAAAVRVLVTGGAGFIGSHVADRLAAEGHEPVVLDALIPQAHGGEKPPWVGELLHADVRDADALRAALRGIDAVCHQAAMVGHGVDARDAPAYAAHNDLGTAVLLAAMYEAGVSRLVLAGLDGRLRGGPVHLRRARRRPARARARPTPSPPGAFEPPCPVCGRDLVPGLVPEDAPLDPRSTYAATKLAQEHLAGAWARQTGGAVWSLRYHNVYGPRMPRDTPYSGVASVFRSALERGEAPRVMEDGRQRRDFVHVGDVAAANVRALDAPPHRASRRVNVCSGEPHTVGDLATELARAMRGPEPVVDRRRPGGRRAARGGRPGPGDAHCWGSPPACGFAEGVRAFATDPLRAPAATEP